MPYRTLDAEKIEATLAKLQARIEERFPGRGLPKLCAELLNIARQDRERLSWVQKPNYLIQASVWLVILIGVGGIIWAFTSYRFNSTSTETFSVLQGVDSVLNIVALAGAAVWFLLNLESRMRRDKVLADLHELRSIAHVVDMHQLTKDPTIPMPGYSSTPSSEHDQMSDAQLVRYLDYCSEMLALTGKLAALYMQGMRDPVIIQTVNEIEELTGNLSRKIWQKIMILRQPVRAP